MQINNSSFKKSSGSQFFDSDDLLDAKERLAGAVLGWMKK
jgi:hypothetical protein